jgi:hypothetical protein
MTEGRAGDAKAGGMLIATNAGKVPRKDSWARLTKKFEKPMNLKNQQAFGVWVDGDGGGELIALRLESPRHISFGALADRYITVDFTGRRLFTLVETESTRWQDYDWGDGKWAYNVYRETIDFGTVESVSVGLQNLAPGNETRCTVGPVKALPMLPGVVRNPTLTLNGTTVMIPLDLPSGSWIECKGPEGCVLYGSRGEVLKTLSLPGAWPTLKSGENRVQFSSKTSSGPAPRARITVFCRGEEL